MTKKLEKVVGYWWEGFSVIFEAVEMQHLFIYFFIVDAYFANQITKKLICFWFRTVFLGMDTAFRNSFILQRNHSFVSFDKISCTPDNE